MLIGFILFTLNLFAQNPTEDFWLCTNREGGKWHFAKAPYICDIYHFSDPDIAQINYDEYVFYDLNDESDEREKYMNQMNGLVENFVDYYFFRKKPQGNEVELFYYKKAIKALLHQESFWSHYRFSSDGSLKYMRGDSGHGHGIAQVDDRWHFVAVQDGSAARLISNLVYAMDLHFDQWQRAPSSECVVGETDYINRTRAAYSAYNGGPSRICRFTDVDNTWYRNDEAYFNKYQAESWNNYITNFEVTPKLDYECLNSGDRICPQANDQTTPSIQSGVFYETTDKEYCHYNGVDFDCFSDYQDQYCFSQALGLEANLEVIPLPKNNIKKNFFDRHLTCQQISGHSSVGDVIQIHKNINFRSTPGGQILKVIPSGSKLQVLDFVYTSSEHKRYYKFYYQGDFGYLYLGKEADFSEWSSPSKETPLNQFVAFENQYVKSLKNIYIRDENLSSLGVLPRGSEVKVLGKWIHTEANLIRYLINYQGVQGYFYAGSTQGEVDTKEWTSFIDETQAEKTQQGRLKDYYYYTYSRSCPSYSCDSVDYILGPRYTSKTFSIISSQNDWAKIKYNEEESYLNEAYIEKIK